MTPPPVFGSTRQSPVHGSKQSLTRSANTATSRSCFWEGCNYRCRGVVDRSDIASHIVAAHAAVALSRGYPVSCKWHNCNEFLHTESSLIDHLTNHTGYTGTGNFSRLVAKPANRKKNPPPTKPCEWRDCAFLASDPIGLATHAVSTHVNRRNLANFTYSCEWASCGGIYMTARELATHLTQQHAQYYRMLVCFCGATVTKGMLEAHEKFCPVLKGDRAPAIVSPSPPPSENCGQLLPQLEPSTALLAQRLEQPLSHPQGLPQEHISKRRRTGSANIPTNNPQIVGSEGWSAGPSSEPVLVSNQEVPNINSPEPERSEKGATADKNTLDTSKKCTTETPQHDEQPLVQALQAQIRQPFLQKIERQRQRQLQQEHEQQQQRAQHIQQRRQERQFRELRELQEKEKKELQLQSQEQQHESQTQPQEPWHENLRGLPEQSQEGNQHRSPSASPMPTDKMEYAAVQQLQRLAIDLSTLSETISTAVDKLPTAYLNDLAEELQNDWMVTDMNSMLQGVMATYDHGGYAKWVSGDRWRNPSG